MKENIDKYAHLLLKNYPELDKMVDSLRVNNSEYYDVLEDAALVINSLCDDEEKLNAALNGYISFCDTFKQKQEDFIRNAGYAHKNYDDVNKEVYQNSSYMSNTYYPALLFSYFFSSNYFEILRNFKAHFLPLVNKYQGNMCEIGIGHGMLSSLALKNNNKLKSYGIDISPIAKTVTKKVNEIFNVEVTEVIIADATQNISIKNNQVIICAEVLEHLPNPELLLSQIHQSMSDDGVFFLTASINMESVDHLYLFKSDNEVEEMVFNSGFEVVYSTTAFLTIQNYRNNEKAIDKLKKRNNPSTSIMILKKKNKTS
jgi:2-polyprenyl-3-methyl-5-hydroxy-6-metoxy-1,4-benzoquinol methylase